MVPKPICSSCMVSGTTAGQAGNLEYLLKVGKGLALVNKVQHAVGVQLVHGGKRMAAEFPLGGVQIATRRLSE